MTTWVNACAADAIEPEDVLRFDHAQRTFVIVRGADDTYHCLDGLCSHEAVHLADGLVMDGTIECPKHQGAFDIATGEAVRAPACRNLKAYPTRVEDGRVQVEL